MKKENKIFVDFITQNDKKGIIFQGMLIAFRFDDNSRTTTRAFIPKELTKDTSGILLQLIEEAKVQRICFDRQQEEIIEMRLHGEETKEIKPEKVGYVG